MEVYLEEIEKVVNTLKENVTCLDIYKYDTDIRGWLKDVNNNMCEALNSLGYSIKKPTISVKYLEGDSVSCTFSRSIVNEDYSDFKESVVTSTSTLVTCAEKLGVSLGNLYVKLVKESIQLSKFSELNKIYDDIHRTYSTNFKVKFLPSIFYGEGKVISINDEIITLTPKFDRFLRLAYSGNFSKQSLENFYSEEMKYLLVAHNVIELLGKQSPLIEYFLDTGRRTVPTILSSIETVKFSKITKKKALGVSIYNEYGVVGVIERTAYGYNVLVEPVDTKSYLRVDVDLISKVERKEV